MVLGVRDGAGQKRSSHGKYRLTSSLSPLSKLSLPTKQLEAMGVSPQRVVATTPSSTHAQP